MLDILSPAQFAQLQKEVAQMKKNQTDASNDLYQSLLQLVLHLIFNQPLDNKLQALAQTISAEKPAQSMALSIDSYAKANLPEPVYYQEFVPNCALLQKARLNQFEAIVTKCADAVRSDIRAGVHEALASPAVQAKIPDAATRARLEQSTTQFSNQNAIVLANAKTNQGQVLGLIAAFREANPGLKLAILTFLAEKSTPQIHMDKSGALLLKADDDKEQEGKRIGFGFDRTPALEVPH